MSAVSGPIVLQVQTKDTLPIAANRLTSFAVLYNPPDSAITYAAGTGPGQANKFAQLNGSAAAAVVDTDLTAVACSDGSTGFSHVREVIVWNDDLVNQLTVGLGTNPFNPFLGGTSPWAIVEPGSHRRFFKPLGINGWTVDSTHKTLRIDPGANTISYRIYVHGD